MSLVTWDWQLAPADGQLLTNDECYLLLDTDFSDDLLKSFPNTPKPDSSPSSDYCISEDGSASLYPSSPPETKPSRAQLATDLLQQLDHQCKQENILSSWLEEKVEIPMFDGLTSIPEGFHPSAPSAAPYAPPHTDELLREFETVYGAVELTHLTPPQSPPATLAPGPASQLLVSYAQNAAAPAPDVWPGVEELLSSPPLTSPQSSAPSSPRSSDDEWSTRPKPYSRGTDDRRTRKKEQNKNAATRYRQKKKAEIEVLLGEEQSLRAKHNELGTKRADLQREIRYLKGLMRELFKAKGLIK